MFFGLNTPASRSAPELSTGQQNLAKLGRMFGFEVPHASECLRPEAYNP